MKVKRSNVDNILNSCDNSYKVKEDQLK